MSRMQAMVLEGAGQPLVLRERDIPVPGPGQALVAVHACGVCRTDLHLTDAELPDIPYPVVPGHQIVGHVLECGDGVRLAPGTRVGIAWIGGSCGACAFCERGEENLCDAARFTGYQIDGGYATHCLADARYLFTLPEDFADLDAAPLLCGGVIGYRSLRLCGDNARRIGLYGFGAAAHIICQVAAWQQREVCAFTKPGDATTQDFARAMGAAWAGDAGSLPPEPLDAAIIFAPAGELVPEALKAVRKGGRVVCGGIHMSDIPSFPYDILWGERQIRSVANLTRTDAREFLELAPKVPVRTRVHTYPLAQANQALDDLRAGAFDGAAVLTAPVTA